MHEKTYVVQHFEAKVHRNNVLSNSEVSKKSLAHPQNKSKKIEKKSKNKKQSLHEGVF